jgi:hypothetical protein
MADRMPVRAEDVLPIHSRVSWSAVLAGAAVSMAVYLLLTLLGAVGGFSVAANVRPETLGIYTLLWSVFAMLVSLFVGGWVATQTTVGENTLEAVIHGVLVWSTVFAIMLGFLAAGVSAGFNALVGMAYAGPALTSEMAPEGWQELARRAGVSQQQIDELRARMERAPETAREAAQAPETREAVRQAGTWITAWTLAGTILSMLAAIGGALAGAGTPFTVLAAIVVPQRREERQYAGKT